MSHQGVVGEPLQQIDREEIAASGNAVTAVVGQGSFLAGLRDSLVVVIGGSIRRNTLRYCALRGPMEEGISIEQDHQPRVFVTLSWC